MNNKPTFLIYIFLAVVFAAMSVSCGGGGGGGGGGSISYAPNSNTPHNGGDAGGWGTGTDTGGGFGGSGSSIEEQEAGLLISQMAALDVTNVTINLIINGNQQAPINADATTTTAVLPRIKPGDIVSGSTTIYLIDGSSRTAYLDETEAKLHGVLKFKVPYKYTAYDAIGMVLKTGEYFSRDGIDLTAQTSDAMAGWKCRDDGTVYYGGYITGARGDIDLEPVYAGGGTYSVTYISEKQAVPGDTYSVTTGLTLPVPSAEGYTFEGWYDNNNYSGSAFLEIYANSTGNKTFYAKWTPIEYTVSYHVPNGVAATVNSNGMTTYTIEQGTSVPSAAEITCSDAVFEGWYDNNNYSGSAIPSIDAGTGDKDLYGKFTATVTFDYKGGTGSPQSRTETCGKTTSMPVTPTKDGFSFGGWCTDSSCTTSFSFTTQITGNITLYAKWTADTYTVNYHVPNGVAATVNSTGMTTYTTDTGIPTLPTAACSTATFQGWYTDNNYTAAASIPAGSTGNKDLYGKFTANVTFNSHSGSAVTAQNNKVCGKDTVNQPADPTRANYVFAGWYTDNTYATAFNFSTTVIGNMTLHAKWNPVITYISPVTLPAAFQPGGAEASYDSTSGKTLSDPEYTGLNFAGWFEDAAFQTGRKTSISQGSTAPITYYAKWTVAVAFNPNGGGGSTVPRNVVYGTKAQPITHPSAPSGSSATFDNWYTGTISGGVLTLANTAFDFDNTVITETTLLYARWVTTISFNANGGSGSFTSLNDVALGSKITFPSPGPTRDNYVFTGWYKNSGCAEADRFKFSDPIDKGMTLYAGWQQVDQSGTRDTYFVSDAGISITDNSGGKTYCLRLNDNSVSGLGTALAVTNNVQGTTTTAYLDIQGTNSFYATYNHGGLKLTTSTSGAKTIKIVFCTSSSGTITLCGGRGCIQVENVTATFELMSGCKATEMKIGSTTYTDFNTFVNAMKDESFSHDQIATLKIERE